MNRCLIKSQLSACGICFSLSCLYTEVGACVRYIIFLVNPFPQIRLAKPELCHVLLFKPTNDVYKCGTNLQCKGTATENKNAYTSSSNAILTASAPGKQHQDFSIVNLVDLVHDYKSCLTIVMIRLVLNSRNNKVHHHISHTYQLPFCQKKYC